MPKGFLFQVRSWKITINRKRFTLVFLPLKLINTNSLHIKEHRSASRPSLPQYLHYLHTSIPPIYQGLHNLQTSRPPNLLYTRYLYTHNQVRRKEKLGHGDDGQEVEGEQELGGVQEVNNGQGLDARKELDATQVMDGE